MLNGNAIVDASLAAFAPLVNSLNTLKCDSNHLTTLKYMPVFKVSWFTWLYALRKPRWFPPAFSSFVLALGMLSGSCAPRTCARFT